MKAIFVLAGYAQAVALEADAMAFMQSKAEAAAQL